MRVICFGVMELGWIITFLKLWSMLLGCIDFYLDLDLNLNLRSLDLDLNRIVVIKELVFDNEQVTIKLCVK